MYILTDGFSYEKFKTSDRIVTSTPTVEKSAAYVPKLCFWNDMIPLDELNALLTNKKLEAERQKPSKNLSMGT